MFCSKCGEILRDSALRCPVCGATQLKKDSKINDPCDCDTNKPVTFRVDRPKTHSSPRSGWEGKTYHSAKSVSAPSYHRGKPTSKEFGQLMLTFFRRSLDFGGRSSRREYWLTRLLLILIGIFAGVLTSTATVLTVLWFLLIPLPYVALHTRRLHDIGKSGWWQLIRFVPIAGELLLDIWFCLPSAPANRWGPKPYV